MSPKVSRSYLWRILIYIGLLVGIIGFITYLTQKEQGKTEPKPKIEDVKEINDFTIEREDS